MDRSQHTDLIIDAATRAAAYVAASPGARVFPGDAEIEALSGFTDQLPESPTDPALVLDELDRIGSPATVRSTGGRYFGFVTGGTDPAAGAASVLSSGWDQNAAMPLCSPTAARLDTIAARWIGELLALPDTATGVFCSGASVANLTCLVAARDALLRAEGWDVAADGLTGAPPIDVVVSEEIHATIFKSLRVLGIGRSSIRLVPTDDRGTMIASELGDLGPRSLLVCQAGNVNTGHSDPFRPLIEQVRDAGGWVHVDGAFGLWARASPGLTHLVDGVELADSWATDAHKWLNVPYDAGVAMCARGEDLRTSMAVGAAYLPAEEDRVPMHLNLQMSQRARGIETWAAIASRGRSGITDLIEGTCRHAARMAELLETGGVEILAPVALNQVLARFDDDDTTDAVIAGVQAAGVCWAGGTTWKGRRAMRISVSDQATTDDDIEVSARSMLAVWSELAT